MDPKLTESRIVDALPVRDAVLGCLDFKAGREAVTLPAFPASDRAGTEAKEVSDSPFVHR
jgi:hypothetical protein